jgi:hypothetical protein
MTKNNSITPAQVQKIQQLDVNFIANTFNGWNVSIAKIAGALAVQLAKKTEDATTPNELKELIDASLVMGTKPTNTAKKIKTFVQRFAICSFYEIDLIEINKKGDELTLTKALAQMTAYQTTAVLLLDAVRGSQKVLGQDWEALRSAGLVAGKRNRPHSKKASVKGVNTDGMNKKQVQAFSNLQKENQELTAKVSSLLSVDKVMSMFKNALAETNAENANDVLAMVSADIMKSLEPVETTKPSISSFADLQAACEAL